MKKNDFLLCLPFFIGFWMLTFLVRTHGFFWDTALLSSKAASFFYENNFASLLLPAEFDAGHPPLMGWYLAMVWKIFGKTLFVSHFAVFPFLIGIVWQLLQLLKNVVPERFHFVSLLVLLSDATFLSQATLVAPDLVLAFGFLLASNGIFKEKNWQIQLGTLLIGFISLRGIFMIPSLILFYYFKKNINRNNFKILTVNSLKLFLPPIFLIFAYLTFHFQQTGWWIFTPNDAWSDGRKIVNISQFFRNIGISIWRLIDFGRVLGVVVFLIFAFLSLKKRSKLSKESQDFIFLGISILVILLPALCISTNPIGHRYWIIFQFIFVIITISIVTNYQKNNKIIFLILSLVIATQISGNFWIYPRGIAMGWDSTLAHLPYYELRRQVQADLRDFPHPIGSSFPNLSSEKYFSLGKNETTWRNKNLDTDEWILYSNVCNDFSDEELQKLDSEWSVQQNWTSENISFVLYQKK